MNHNLDNIFHEIDCMDSVEIIDDFIKKNSINNLNRLFWINRKIVLNSSNDLEKKRALAKCKYIERMFSASIPIKKDINRFIAPHGLAGISISYYAKLGVGCTVFQHVTIGSNTIPDSKGAGFPIVGNNVYIGAGASIIGNVHIGNNCRIGAGCVVVCDVPDDCVVCLDKPILKQKNNLNNQFITANDYRKLLLKNVRGGGGKNSNSLQFTDKIEELELDKAFKIMFSGDLILLEDQVKRAYNGITYEFNELFEYTEKYIKKADFSIGVLEGPIVGQEAGFSNSNFRDGKKLELGYPFEFAEAIKKAGFDLVTCANNHMLDKGVYGLKSTLDSLNEIGLDSVGMYRNAEEKCNKKIKIIEREGITFAILAYTYGSNGILREALINGDLSYCSSIIFGVKGEQFEMLKKQVEEDFKLAKSYNPDFIIVLPHIGRQFRNEPSDTQRVWVNIFKEFGADIIFCNHAHAVQPFLIEELGGKKIATVFCPGNYANIYRKNMGDTSILASVYIDKETKKIICGGIIPLYCHANIDGNYRALPIYDIKNNKELRKQISTDDYEKVKQAHSLITKVIFDKDIDIGSVQKEYLFNNKYLIKKDVETIEINADESYFLSNLVGKSICFLGDSITEGTKNNFVGWYEPIRKLLGTEMSILNYSRGGCVTQFFIKNKDNIPEADTYVIAVGTNDVRYRNSSICAMDSKEYVNRIGLIREIIRGKNYYARLIFIAPWYSTDGDKVARLDYKSKERLNVEYTNALKEFCEKTGDIFVNPNPYIKNVLAHYPHERYLIDAIHPNASEGVMLYSEAVCKYNREAVTQ